MRIILIFLLLILKIHQSICCECPPTNEESVKRIFEKAEIIVIGHAVRNMDYNVEVRKSWDNRSQGFDVLFKVDSVLKGDTTLKEVIVTQLLSDGCSRRFDFGEPMILSGTSITKFVNLTPERPTLNEGEIPPTEMPPPPPGYASGPTLFLYNSELGEAYYWNELARNNSVISSSLCTSYYVNSEAGAYFLK